MHLNASRSIFALVLAFALSFNAAIGANATDSNTAIAQPKMATASVLPPKMVNPLKTKIIMVKLKSAVVLTVKNPEIWKGKVVDPKIAKFVAGGPISAYETYPSIVPLKKGKTTISFTDGKKTYFLKLTVL
ncbi:MAG: hypothetical protein NTV18_04215 [Actinobacteria bacterium]|nr:hypothetical protein [Actinomycetota bacterium]